MTISPKLEALVDAIARLNSLHNPESKAYRLKNPLLLRSYALLGRHDTDSDGLRVFTSILGGLKAAHFDCQLKVNGLSRAGLKPTDRLRNLLGVYNIHEKQAIDTVVAFLRRALEDQSISADTTLSFFSSKVTDGR